MTLRKLLRRPTTVNVPPISAHIDVMNSYLRRMRVMGERVMGESE